MKIKNSIFIVIIFITISFFVSASIYSIENNFKLVSSVNDFLSTDTENLKIFYNGTDDIDMSLFSSQENYTLVKNSEENYRQYGIYFKGDLHNDFNIIKGRFFNEKDFSENEKLAVVGKNRLNSTVNIDGEEYIFIEDDYYKVIGIIGGDKEELAYDDAIYYSLSALINSNSKYIDGKYWIDGRNNTDNIINSITSNSNYEIYKDDIGNYEINYLKENLLSDLGFIFLVIIVLVLSSSIVTELWIQNRRKEIGIKRALGATRLNISVSIIKELLSIGTVSYICGYILYLSITLIKDGYLHFYGVSMLSVYLITIFSALLVAIVPIVKSLRLQPKEIMR